MKIHQLQHLPMFVEAFGPLWAFSCFPYENSNGQAKGLVHGTRYIASQLCVILFIPQTGYCVLLFSSLIKNTLWEFALALARANKTLRQQFKGKKIKEHLHGLSEITLKFIILDLYCTSQIMNIFFYKIFNKPFAKPITKFSQ